MNAYVFKETRSPLAHLECNFNRYVQTRQAKEHLHQDGNSIADYAFGLDYELRKKLDAIPQLYNISKKVMSTTAGRMIQTFNRNALAVGPNQMPEVYQIACDCARTLGIGIPNIFILGSPDINAFTCAADDIEPIIVIYSGLYERATPEILRAIIGHECGHIHNDHVMYETVARLLLSGGLGFLSQIPGVNALTNLLTAGTKIALSTWSRAAEVTADRASVICSSPEDALRTQMLLMYGGARNVDINNIDLAAIQDQLKMQMDNIARYDELLDDSNTHPATARRIAAIQAFANCETLFSWRPELKKPGAAVCSKLETEERCRQVINVTRTSAKRK